MTKATKRITSNPVPVIVPIVKPVVSSGKVEKLVKSEETKTPQNPYSEQEFSEVLDRIRDLLAYKISQDERNKKEAITVETAMVDLNLDGIDRAFFHLRVEGNFDIRFPFNIVKSWKTVKEVVEFVLAERKRKE